MTLPKASTKLSVDFNQFDAMSFPANVNENVSIAAPVHMHAEQEQPEQPNGSFFNNNTAFATAQSLAAGNAPESAPTSVNMLPHTATTANTSTRAFPKEDLAVENVMPGIYLSKNFMVWNEEILHAHGFTHIIVIDKHIQELYYPSPIFKICAQSKSNISHDPYEDPAVYSDLYYAQPTLNFGKEFEALDLNFGEKSYLTTVLPNCYRAVRFINKALQTGGTILVIDCNGGEQKCLTIIVAYLMYKHNITFSAAFARIKTYYKKADLDRFFISQLYEYEPILQVQRAQSRGHSCSREMHAAILKRKKADDDDVYSNSSSCVGMTTAESPKIDGTNLLFDSLNPLAQFDANNTELKRNHFECKQRLTDPTKSFDNHHHSIYQQIHSQNPYTSQQEIQKQHQQQRQQLMHTYNSNWDDNAME